MENKRKLYKVKTLQGKYIKYKNVKTEEILSNTVTSEENEISHFNPTSSFKLIVIKLPWYKKLFNSIKSLLGLGYF